MTVAAVWLIAVGAVLLGTGFVFELTTPPNTGANIGAAGCFLLGLFATGAGLLLGMAAVVAWLLERRRVQSPAVELLAGEKRRKRLAWASAWLITAAAIVLGWGTLVFHSQRAPVGVESAIIGEEKAFPIFLTGFCFAGASLLAALPRYWRWIRRSDV
ncbi:hypothetical protein [Amycolatopsis silviterrae]|uniref:Uncharacterized protein n=1 Tax=Amycolatopsis silviterrae TaxID=1656914 RepID=A0ABW5H3D7_9PSEU